MTISWNAGTSGLWNTAANWSPAQVPGAADDAAIAAAGNYLVLANGSVAVNSLTLNDAGAELQVAGSMTLGAALALDVGTIDIPSGDLLSATNPSVTGGSIIADGTVALTGSYDTAVLNSIQFGTSAAAFLSGTLDNASAVFDASQPAYQTFSFGSLTIEGGTIISLPDVFALTLSATTVKAPTAIDVLRPLTITNGWALLNGAGTGPGVVQLTGGPTPLIFQGDQTFAVGSIIDISATAPPVTITATGSLTLGSGALIQDPGSALFFTTNELFLNGAGIFINQGTVAVGGGYTPDGGYPLLPGEIEIESPFINDGSVIAHSGLITADGTFDNMADATVSVGGMAISGGTTFAAGVLTLDSTANNAGTVTVDGGTISVAGTHAFINSGLVQLSQGRISLASSVTLDNEGTLLIGSGGSITIGPALAGTGTIELAGGSAELDNVAAASQTIDFTGTAAPSSLTLDQPIFMASPIVGFAPGDIINLGVAATGVSYSGNVLEMQTTGSIPFSLSIVGTHQFADFIITTGSNSTEITVSCFAAGTRIATDHGDVPIEHLHKGDCVLTLLSGKAKPIGWIGHRLVDCEHHPDPAKVWPVRIVAHAFGAGMPSRSLLLSPDHAVYSDGVLIPIKCLINGTTIAQIRMRRVDYYHIELAGHDVVFAEGLPTESYLDTGDRSHFANGTGPVRLHPDFAARTWEGEGCAPLVMTGPLIDALRARLAEKILTRRTRRTTELHGGPSAHA